MSARPTPAIVVRTTNCVTCHRDGSVTYFDPLCEQWVECARTVPIHALTVLPADEEARAPSPEPPWGVPVKFTIPREIQSGNALAYRHWRVRQRDKVAWLMLLRARIIPGLPPPAYVSIYPTSVRKAVTITAYRKRTLDDDNLVAGAKHLRDGLITVGLIKDDNKTWATFTYRQELASASPLGRGTPCTVIEIEDAS